MRKHIGTCGTFDEVLLERDLLFQWISIVIAILAHCDWRVNFICLCFGRILSNFASPAESLHIWRILFISCRLVQVSFSYTFTHTYMYIYIYIHTLHVYTYIVILKQIEYRKFSKRNFSKKNKQLEYFQNPQFLHVFRLC